MNFETAMENLKRGRSVKRKCWENGMHLKLSTQNSYRLHKDRVISDTESFIEQSGLFFLLIHNADNPSHELKWIPCQSDLLALDWTHRS